MDSWGENKYPPPKTKSLLRLYLEAFKEPLLMVLAVLGIISAIVGGTLPEDPEHHHGSWG